MLANVTDDPFLWHQDFLSGVVIPNPVFFSYLVAFGELAIGISLVLGCLVRVSSLFGAFHNLNIYLAIGIPQGGAVLGLNRLFIVCLLVFAVAGAGRALGVDAILKRKFFRSWLF
jgi:thiosulfate dehydrogenase [quinone] large subunit